MATIYLYSIVSVIAVSFVSLAGIFTLSLKEYVLRKYVFVLVSLAVGALLGDVFIHLIPQAFSDIGNATYVAITIMGGIFIFFTLEKILHWHHHARGEEREETIHPTGRMILISDGVHNFIDGLIIAGSYLISVELGIATTLAVILHEIPQEIGDFGVLIHSGYTVNRALWVNFLTALTAIAGALLALLASNMSNVWVTWLIPFAAGGFIYIAMSDLVPELHKTKGPGHSFLQFIAIFFGILAMLLLLIIE
ncbi:MAG TPA: ZIP family metal transporter [Candidatus Paceibacterota bacterium]